jgi:DNA-directed RNA polymerase subunit RPC12/RpoP
MPADIVTISQLCGKCRAELSTFEIKKDNMMLTTEDEIWCPHCNENTPEVRDVAGRLEAIRKETASYPKAVPATPFTAASANKGSG